MAETKSLAASVRTGVGKGAARSVRREGRIPAVVYGGGEPPTPIALSWHDVNKLIYAGGFMTTRFELDIDGVKEQVIPRDYQLDRVKDRPLHVDFLRLKKGQKIDVEIPVHATGQDEAPGLKKGGTLNIVRHVVELNVPADAIPEHIEVDISKLEIGDSIHVTDLKLPRGARLSTAAEAEFAVLTIAAPLVEPEVEDEAVATTAPAADGETAGDEN
jgi:large subunit ribosomal protein L25